MHDITSSSCKLKWKPPEDDGGKPITGYVVEKMDKETGRWVPVSRTDPDVTECPVRGLQEGHEYMFRVKAVNDEGESDPLETEAAIKAKDPYGKGCSRGLQSSSVLRFELSCSETRDCHVYVVTLFSLNSCLTHAQACQILRATSATWIGTLTASTSSGTRR